MGIARNIARLIPNGSGLLPNANIEAVAASKLTGQVALATQVSGTLPDANAPSGSVIQAVYGQRAGNEVYTNSTTATTTNLTASITPSSTSSKIMVIGGLCVRGDGGDTNTGYIDLYRNGSPIFTGIMKWSASNVDSQQFAQYLDSPNSTSSVTYTFYIKSTGSSNDVRFNPTSSGDANSTIILLEIAG